MNGVESHEEGRLSLQEAADRLGVHYMTAYRYVRTGRLPAERSGARWIVAERDLRALAGESATPAGRGRSRDRTGDLVRRLVAGDEPGAWAVLEGALAGGMTPARVHLELVVPALAAIGERWSEGRLTVSEEHRASAVTQRLIGRIGPLFARRGPRRGAIVVGAVAGEHHGLPSAMLSDLLRGEGFEVVDLGADTPAESFVEAAAADRLRAIVLGAHGSGRVGAVRATVGALRRAGIDVPILAGGGGIGSTEDAASAGADAWTGPDGASAVRTITSLALEAQDGSP